MILYKAINLNYSKFIDILTPLHPFRIFISFIGAYLAVLLIAIASRYILNKLSNGRLSNRIKNLITIFVMYTGTLIGIIRNPISLDSIEVTWIMTGILLFFTLEIYDRRKSHSSKKS